MTWNPPANVRAAGERIRGRVPNVQGSQLTSDTETIQRPIEPGTEVLRRYIASRWGVSVGAARGGRARRPARRDDGTLRRRDVHEEGRALDAMSEANIAKGTEIANFIAERALELGVQYMIFDRTELSSSTIGPAWEPYDVSGDRSAMGRRRDPHTDHVHIEITPAMARDANAMRRALGLAEVAGETPSSSSTSHTAPAPGSSAPNERTGAMEHIERSRVYTGPRPFRAWASSRFELLYLLVSDQGIPSRNALHVARSLVGLCVSETGWQRTQTQGEACFNGANITGATAYGFFRIDGARHFRAYASAREGYADLVRVLSTHGYRAAWDRLVLLGDPIEWYSSILRAGFTGWSQELVDGYQGVLGRIPREYQRTER